MKLKNATVWPAYGRDYKNRRDAEAAFRRGEDFHFTSFPIVYGEYCSIRDFEPGAEVSIRYNRKEKQTIITV